MPSPVPEHVWDTFGGEISRPITGPTAQELAAQVERHYDLDSTDGTTSHFVGGMGESDLGVCFVSPPNSSTDPLQHWQLIQETIALVKESRHGVPFSLVTSGCHVPSDLPPLAELGLSNVQVLLLASSPPDYAAVTGIPSGEAAKLFGQVCGFMVHASEETGFPVTAGIAGGPYATSASELAKALGAIDVHIYDISK